MKYVPARLRREVTARAGNCCEYCLRSQEDTLFAFHMEHIVSEKHHGETTLDNLALSCPTYNSYKGTDIAGADPLTGEATFLFHPRRQRWDDHFRLNMAHIEPITAEGRVTVFLLQLNEPPRLAERELLIRLKRYPCPKIDCLSAPCLKLLYDPLIRFAHLNCTQFCTSMTWQIVYSALESAG